MTHSCELQVNEQRHGLPGFWPQQEKCQCGHAIRHRRNGEYIQLGTKCCPPISSSLVTSILCSSPLLLLLRGRVVSFSIPLPPDPSEQMREYAEMSQPSCPAQYRLWCFFTTPARPHRCWSRAPPTISPSRSPSECSTASDSERDIRPQNPSLLRCRSGQTVGPLSSSRTLWRPAASSASLAQAISPDSIPARSPSSQSLSP